MKTKSLLTPLSVLFIFVIFLCNVNAQSPNPGDVIWHTFQGGLLADKAFGIDTDNDGNLYVVGHSDTDWDMTNQAFIAPKNPHNVMIHDNRRLDVFVAKFNPDGLLIWYTFIGDAGSNDYGWDIAVDSDGEIFIVGQTLNWYLTNVWHEENRAFLAKFDTEGNFLWMHKMGRRDSPTDLAGTVDVDASGNVYMMGANVLGWNWPNPSGDPFGPINPFKDAYGSNYFVAKFNNDGDYQWHTFIGPHAVGGNSNGGNMDIVVKGSDVYLTGASYFRMDIPGVVPAIDHDEGNIDGDRVCQEGFVLKMNMDGKISWYSYLGYDYNAAPLNSGDGAWTNGIDADMAGNIYITGNSPRNFRYPLLSPIHAKHAFGDTDCFIMKINSNKNTTDCIEWNTFWSYNLNDRGEDIKLDDYGNVFVGANGLSSSNVMIMLDDNGKMQWLRGLWDYPGTGNQHSIALDESGNLFFTGYSGPPWATSLGGTVIHAHQVEWNEDAFLAKMYTGVDYTAPPTLYVDKPVVTRSVSDTYVENTGRVFHPDMEHVTLDADLGFIDSYSGNNWTWRLNQEDFPDVGFYPVTVTATVGDGPSSQIKFYVQIVENGDGERIAQALWWLVRQQRDDGSWGGLPFYPEFIQIDEPVTASGWAMTVLCQHAYINGFLPFDDDYPYVQYIKAGFDYLFSMTDGPGYDIDGENHLFVCEETGNFNWRELNTAAALLAICASETPNRIIDYPDNPLVDGLTYQEFAQKIVNHFYHIQFSDTDLDEYGGWDWWDFHTGHIVSALTFAEPFGCTMPGDLKNRLSQFVDNRYLPGTWDRTERMTNAGNLMMEMAFFGDEIIVDRVQDALHYIETTWPIPRPDPDPDNGFDGQWTDKNLELFNVLMRGLASFNIETISVDEDGDGEPESVNWYDVLYDETINHANQNDEGYWGCSWNGDRLLNTCWALLTLYKIVPDYDNIDPVIDVDEPQLVSDYSEPVVNSGTYSDEDDNYTYLDATMGDVVDNGDGTWSWSLNTVLNNGIYNIRISAYDGHGGFAETTFQLTINSTNEPPVITCPDDQQFNANVNCSYAGHIGTASATDDSGEDPIITNDAPQYFPLGDTEVTWSATDNLGFTSECTQTITVIDNQNPEFVMDCPLEDIEVVADNGEGATINVPYPDVYDNCEVTITGERSDGYLLSDPYPIGKTVITWRAEDKSNNISEICEQTIIVLASPPPIIECPENIFVEANENCSFNGEIGTPTVTDENGDECIGCTVDNNAPDIFELGETIVTWTATNTAGESSTCVQIVYVFDNEDPIISVCALNREISANASCEGTVPDLTGDITASDNCDTELTITQLPAAGTDLILGEPTTVTITVTDDASNIATCTADVTLKNTKPTISSLSTFNIDPVQVNTPVTLYVEYTDSENNVASAQIDWGEGNPEIIENPLTSFDETHSYDSAGVYSVKVSISDGCNLVSGTYNYFVVYDPSDGFVTGGGWIDSPWGAYINDETLTGKANFGFVSKYKKGQSTPDGNTEFKFHAADLNFHSSLYDWLVIAGAKAMFKGEGTINNLGWYGFQLSAIDADLTPSTDVDLFRIQIWDKNDGDAIVYDNKLGDEDPNADPNTEIAGGSIVIHVPKKKSALISPVDDPQDKRLEVTVYPNPTKGNVAIEIENYVTPIADVVITNVAGQKVFEQTCGLPGPIKLDLSDKITGLYLIYLDVDGQQFVHKINLMLD